MAKRKKRYTGQFWNKQGDHLWAYLELDWRDPSTASKMAGSLAQAVGDVDCSKWVVLCVEYESEKNFTTFLKRRIKESTVPAGYLVIRVKSTVKSEGIDSWYFMHGLEYDVIAAKSDRYSIQPPALIARNNILGMIQTFLNVDMHPELPGHRLNRWSASKETRWLLTFNRAKHLVECARGNPTVPFEEALVSYMIHDRPLMFVLKKDDKLSVLKDTGFVSEDELMKVSDCMESEWERVDIYEGSPSDGAALDAASGKFKIKKGGSYIFADRKKKLTERERGWEVIERPESEENGSEEQ